MRTTTIFYFGHPKAGSTWLGGLMAGISIDLGLNFFYGQYVLPANQRILKQKQYDVVISQNSDYQKLLDLGVPYKGFHVIRDPRDTCVSSYFSYKKTHKINDWHQLKTLRSKLNNLSFDDGIREIFRFNQEFFTSLKTWNYNDPDILEVKYEDLIFDTDKQLNYIFNFLFPCVSENSIKFNTIATYNRIIFRQRSIYNQFKVNNPSLPIARINHLNKKLSFKNLSKGRKQGQEDSDSHYRKGISGDWKNYIKGDLKKEFKELYGDLLIYLGYEKDNLW